MKNYELDENALSSWVPWGGLVRPFVQRNKDGSFIGIIRLVHSEQEEMPSLTNIPFNSGWCLWHEFQNFGSFKAEYIFVLWNPMFLVRKKKWIKKVLKFLEMPKDRIIWNVLEEDNAKKIREEDAELYFERAMSKICTGLNERYQAEILSHEAIINALSSTVSMEKETFAMPKVPLFFDVLCTDVKMDMRENDIVINNKKMSIVSVPSVHHFGADFKRALFERLQDLPFRFSMRAILADQKNSEAYLKKYTSSWCRNRKVIRENIRKYMLKDLNGFFSNTFIFFHENEDELDKISSQALEVFRDMGIPYIVERRNYKVCWWSTLPGMFRAKEHFTISGCSMENFFELSCSL